MVIKQFLLMRGLNEVYSGGLGSFALALMVTNFLKVHPLVQSGAIDQLENVGVLLMEFFDLYGRRLVYDGVGLTIEDHRLYFRKQFQRAGALCVMDPSDAGTCRVVSTDTCGSPPTHSFHSFASLSLPANLSFTIFFPLPRISHPTPPHPTPPHHTTPHPTDNDVTRGSFNMPSVRRSLANAMDILEGTFFEWSERAVSGGGGIGKATGASPASTTRHKDYKFRLRSLLGTIIQVQPATITHREFVHHQYWSQWEAIDEAIRFMGGVVSLEVPYPGGAAAAGRMTFSESFGKPIPSSSLPSPLAARKSGDTTATATATAATTKKNKKNSAAVSVAAKDQDQDQDQQEVSFVMIDSNSDVDPGSDSDGDAGALIIHHHLGSPSASSDASSIYEKRSLQRKHSQQQRKKEKQQRRDNSNNSSTNNNSSNTKQQLQQDKGHRVIKEEEQVEEDDEMERVPPHSQEAQSSSPPPKKKKKKNNNNKTTKRNSLDQPRSSAETAFSSASSSAASVESGEVVESSATSVPGTATNTKNTNNTATVTNTTTTARKRTKNQRIKDRKKAKKAKKAANAVA